MEHSVDIQKKIENSFLSLPLNEKSAVISHGVAIRFSDLNKRLFQALSKIRLFEEKYQAEPCGQKSPSTARTDSENATLRTFR